MSDELSRREVARRGLLLGGAFVAAGAVSPLFVTPAALAEGRDDQTVLEAAVRLEQTAAAMYASAVARDLLDRRAAEMAKLFGDQERAHADALVAALESLGASVPAVPEPGEIKRMATQADFVRRAIALERESVATYYEAQCSLEEPELLSLTARIMAGDGQHLALLRSLAGESPVPHAFERGVA